MQETNNVQDIIVMGNEVALKMASLYMYYCKVNGFHSDYAVHAQKEYMELMKKMEYFKNNNIFRNDQLIMETGMYLAELSNDLDIMLNYYYPTQQESKNR